MRTVIFFGLFFCMIACKSDATKSDAAEAIEKEHDHDHVGHDHSEHEEPNLSEQTLTDLGIIDQFVKDNSLNAKSTETGLHYIIENEGAGEHPKKGQQVKVHYRGTLLNGKQFDSSYERGTPISFQLGVGQVIPGWDEGIALLKKGGKGKLIIPSEIAYGSREIPGVIPANSVLLFDVELVDVK